MTTKTSGGKPSTGTGPTAHSRIGASSMYRWSECPGSVKLSRGIESKSSVYAEEGTEAHEVAALRLITGDYASTVDPEMQEHVEVYVKAVESEKGERLIEHQFDLSDVHAGLFGTCDAIVFDKEAKTLRVFDLKYGAGIPVEVFEDGKGNPQLMYYGLGALLSTGFPCDFVELVIVQPRCNHTAGPIRRYTFPSFDLLDFAADLKDFAVMTEDENAVLSPGDHCRFCPAAGICTEIKNKAQVLAKKEFGSLVAKSDGILKNEVSVVGGNPVVAGEAATGNGGVACYDPAELSKTLEWLPIVEGWAKGVRDFAYNEVSSGKKIPGWKLVEKRKTRKWMNEGDIETFLKKEFPMVHDFYEAPALKSVAQVEKVLHKKQHEKLTPYIFAQSSGNVLVPESDARPGVNVIDAKTEFQVLDLMS